MKILFIINSLTNRSGTERVATQLANELTLLNNESLTIATRDTDRNECAYELNNDIKLLKLSGNIIQFFLKLKGLILKEQFDFIVMHNMGKLSLLCSLLPTSIKLISLEHVAFSSRPSYVQLISKLLYKRINQVITLTEEDKLSFDKFHPNVMVIPNFSPYPVISEKKSGSKSIIAVGRLTKQKNFIHAIKVWEKIHHQINDWQLDIYGDGEQEDLLLDYIKINEISNIRIHKSTPNIADVYADANFFLMSSKYEGLPMVLIEAQSFGLPIISYDCPHGPRSIIQHGVNGFLVENQNIDQLSEAILCLAGNNHLQEEMSKHSLDNAKKYEKKEIIYLWMNQVFQNDANK